MAKKTLLLIIWILSILVLASLSPAEALYCEVPTVAYPDLDNAFLARCTHIKLIGDVSEPGILQYLDPPGDVYIDGDGHTLTILGPSSIIRFRSLSMDYHITITDLNIVFTDPATSHLVFDGGVNATLKNVSIYVSASSPSNTIVLFTNRRGVTTFEADGLNISSFVRANVGVYLDVRVGLEYAYLRNMEIDNTWNSVIVSTSTGRVGNVSISDSRVDGALALLGLNRLTGDPVYVEVDNVYGGGVVRANFIDIRPTDTEFHIKLSNIHLEREAFYGILFTNQRSRGTIEMSNIYLNGLSSSFTIDGISIQNTFSRVPQEVNVVASNITIVGFRWGIRVNNPAGVVKAYFEDVLLWGISRDSIAVDVREGDIPTELVFNGLEMRSCVGGLNAYVTRGGILNTTFIDVYSDTAFPAFETQVLRGPFDRTTHYLTIIGWRDELTWLRRSMLLWGAFTSPTSLYVKVVKSVFKDLLATGTTEVELIESVFNEWGITFYSPATVHSRWTLEVVVQSKSTYQPIPGIPVEIYLDSTLVASGVTGSDGAVRHTFDYTVTPPNYVMPRLKVVVEAGRETVEITPITDLGIHHTMPSWYQPLYINITYLLLKAVGFSSGYGPAALELYGSWAVIYQYSMYPSSHVDGGWRIYISIGSTRDIGIYMVVYGVATVNGESTPIVIYVNRVNRVVWIPGPIRFLGWY